MIKEDNKNNEVKDAINRLFVSRSKVSVLQNYFEMLGDSGDIKELVDFASCAYGTSAICEEIIDAILAAEDVIRSLSNKEVTA